MDTKIKLKADLERVLGSGLAKTVMGLRGASMKRLPTYVTFKTAKPSFALSDGDTLSAYAVNLATGEISREKYCGSGDSYLHHRKEQDSEGFVPPKGTALLFIQTYWNGRNTSWNLYVVSEELTKQIA